ncbi:hypothetical protein FB451DRAFT_1041075 [Mycena latifolia]|nr:hypothetical protein FB451DRAFT_1041075 [Mycena latifolia]
MPLTLLFVNLATVAIASVFYGMYFILFFISMYLLLRKRNKIHPSNTPLKGAHIFGSMVFISAVFLFLVVTSHWITIVYRAFLAFVHFRGGSAAETFYSDNAQPSYRILNVFLTLSIFTGDTMIIYRLWVVWSYRRLVTLVPICTLTLFTGCVLLLIMESTTVVSAISAHIIEHSPTVFSDVWLTVASVFTLITNIYCTIFIAWRIWTITKASVPTDAPNLRNFLAIVVESAAIYAFWAVLFAIAYESKSNLAESVIQTAPAMVGGVNALIHTRVGLGWSSEQTQGPWPASPIRFVVRDAEDGAL